MKLVSVSYFRAALLTGLFGCLVPMASAQLTPATVRLVVPFTPGGSTDILARAIGPHLAAPPEQSVLSENRPGAGGSIGADLVAKARPDGTTLLMGHIGTLGVNPSLYPKLPYDPVKSFEPVMGVAKVPNVLVVSAASDIRSLKDLIAKAKARPGHMTYSSGGNGSAGHLAGELFKQRAGIFALHIPYNGGNPAQLALLGGQVDFNFDNLATAAANIKAGKLKALAVTTAQRSAALPDVPAVAELYPGFAVDTWWGLIAPAGTPPEVINRLNKAYTEALAHPDVKARFATLMAETAPSTPDQFATFMSQERAKYGPVVKASGARVD